MNILIAGGSGFIGRYISRYLTDKGYTVSLLSRNKNTCPDYACYYWNPALGEIDQKALYKKDIIINLSGAGIADKLLTQKRKEIIYRSRIDSTALLVDTLTENNYSPSLFISASAIGYYGNRPQEQLSEISTPGKDFIAGLCRDWELKVMPLKGTGIPIAILRIGIVLGKKGGSLSKLVFPLRFRMNVLFGRGQHSISWIHIHDLARIIEQLILGKLQAGIYNAVSPDPVLQAEFNSATIHVLGKRSINLRIPKKFLRIFLGDLATVLTADQHIRPEYLIKQKFHFNYPDIYSTLVDLLGK